MSIRVFSVPRRTAAPDRPEPSSAVRESWPRERRAMVAQWIPVVDACGKCRLEARWIDEHDAGRALHGEECHTAHTRAAA